VSIVPASQATAVDPWAPGERLVVAGQAGFKDFWPRAVAASLSRPQVWVGLGGPARVDGVAPDWPGLAERRNLNALRIAEAFDDPSWRAAALDLTAQAVAATGRGPHRVALPAVLGLRRHPEVLAEAVERLGAPVIELPLVSPGIPGIRLHDVLRTALRARGGRILIGERVARVETSGRMVTAVATTAATREMVTRVGALVLATGGVAGGGLVGEPEGGIRETILGLPVDGPPIDRWLAGDPLDPGSLPIAAAGLRTDDALRPIDPARPKDGPLFDNVRVVGGLLAGQRMMVERCGDGVALASAWRAAASLSGGVSKPKRSGRKAEAVR
jgi:glycerol-3-phosphate dehydrogenase subunit B